MSTTAVKHSGWRLTPRAYKRLIKWTIETYGLEVDGFVQRPTVEDTARGRVIRARVGRKRFTLIETPGMAGGELLAQIYHCLRAGQ